ncbi:MFS transporter [Rhodococcus pyridinivorans]|uniref:MFS transporter n=1 Tax=Rhodococcus pyridinivorans TaxID=103816 RepID=UPI001FFED2DB|nr:MFS transporter [Rhodococcus pyridinivorans]UPK64637.1 MFS transporter [Rhodococcus pyridinivorans]
MTTPTPARSTATKRITLLVVCVTTAMLMLDIAVVNTALPSIAVDLDAGVSSLQWVIDAYTLALATAVLGAGSWADRRGRRQVFVVGLVWFTGASLLCALAPTIWVLDLARAVQGIGGAVLFACSLALLADVFDRGRARASALAAYGATIGGAFAVGPLVGGLLTELLDWRAIFFVNVPIGLVTLLLTLRWVPESRDPRPRAADVPGQLLAAVGLAAFVFAVLRGHEIGWSDAQAVIAFVLAVGALVAFVAHEMRTAEPMLPRTCSPTGPSSERRSRPSPSRPRCSRYSSTPRCICRTSCCCRRCRPGWCTCPRPSPCSSSPVRRRNSIVSSLRGSRCRAHWRSSPSGCS